MCFGLEQGRIFVGNGVQGVAPAEDPQTEGETLAAAAQMVEYCLFPIENWVLALPDLARSKQSTSRGKYDSFFLHF